MDANFILTFLLLICLSHDCSSRIKAKDESSDEIFENILRERGLAPPHELFGKTDKKKHLAADDQNRPNNEMLQEKEMEINSLKDKLNECNFKRSKVMEEFVEKTIMDSSRSLELPYLKQIFRTFLAGLNGELNVETNVTKMLFLVDDKDKDILLKCLDDEKDVQTCVDAFMKFLKTAHAVKPSQIMQTLLKYLEKIKLEQVMYIMLGTAFIISCFYATKVILSRNSLLGMAVVLLIISFLLSVPWEWMRMYKKELAAKAMKMEIKTSGCFNDNLSYVGMFRYWFQDTFSFADSDCLQHYESMMVDPHWEVTPGQAVAAASSRIFLQPALHIAEHLGKFFRLIFKEVPVQWQPFIFIAMVVSFLFSIGIQIYTPLLRIGRGGEGDRNALAAQRAHIAALEGEVGRLNRQLENYQALPAVEQRRNEVPEIRENINANDYIFVEANANADANVVEDVREDEGRRPKQPIESVDNHARLDEISFQASSS